ncbi:MAG: hypothetical protein LCH95_12515 [Proteobacteria bacterium]|nr:hypothetical protein [Pseudomonadota bacterium]
MADNRPGDTDMHRRQRAKNYVMAIVLLAMAAIFFGLTIVRMGPHS